MLPEKQKPTSAKVGSTVMSKGLAATGTYPTFNYSATDFAAALIAARWHLPAPTARVVVELAGIGGDA
ncbi:hypothetical protein [Mesorhizobium sp.]|uniref:hypothetical protein n=1 Tax=Mesorhizobium sp. TaxID=1871066 RepID=UPI000FE74F73|nr:hypothetical protein [Mesorhizobium sp.]RWN59620.1 MAG: hypothetical protein EOS00_19310 [Mesorhizobium sp.]